MSTLRSVDSLIHIVVVRHRLLEQQSAGDPSGLPLMISETA